MESLTSINFEKEYTWRASIKDVVLINLTRVIKKNLDGDSLLEETISILANNKEIS